MKKTSLLVAALICTPFAASAGCLASSTMGGNWQLFTGGDGTDTTECTMYLAPNGAFNSGGCRGRSAGGTASVAISSGSVTITSACTVTGAFTLANGSSLHIDAARLDASRNILLGVGHDSSAGYAPFQMIRY